MNIYIQQGHENVLGIGNKIEFQNIVFYGVD